MKDLSQLVQRVDPFVQAQFGDEMRRIFQRVDCGYFRIDPRTNNVSKKGNLNI